MRRTPAQRTVVATSFPARCMRRQFVCWGLVNCPFPSSSLSLFCSFLHILLHLFHHMHGLILRGSPLQVCCIIVQPCHAGLSTSSQCPLHEARGIPCAVSAAPVASPRPTLFPSQIPLSFFVMFDRDVRLLQFWHCLLHFLLCHYEHLSWSFHSLLRSYLSRPSWVESCSHRSCFLDWYCWILDFSRLLHLARVALLHYRVLRFLSGSESAGSDAVQIQPFQSLPQRAGIAISNRISLVSLAFSRV